MSAPRPKALVLGGVNGAGKTTASRVLLADELAVKMFVNADVIATGIGGFAPEEVAFEASRIMLERLHRLVASRADFAFETTLAGKSYVAFLRNLRTAGYEIGLHY